MAEMTCPRCGGQIVVVPGVQKVRCRACFAEFKLKQPLSAVAQRRQHGKRPVTPPAARPAAVQTIPAAPAPEPDPLAQMSAALYAPAPAAQPRPVPKMLPARRRNDLWGIVALLFLPLVIGGVIAVFYFYKHPLHTTTYIRDPNGNLVDADLVEPQTPEPREPKPQPAPKPVAKAPAPTATPVATGVRTPPSVKPRANPEEDLPPRPVASGKGAMRAYKEGKIQVNENAENDGWIKCFLESQDSRAAQSVSVVAHLFNASGKELDAVRMNVSTVPPNDKVQFCLRLENVKVKEVAEDNIRFEIEDVKWADDRSRTLQIQSHKAVASAEVTEAPKVTGRVLNNTDGQVFDVCVHAEAFDKSGLLLASGDTVVKGGLAIAAGQAEDFSVDNMTGLTSPDQAEIFIRALGKYQAPPPAAKPADKPAEEPADKPAATPAAGPAAEP